MISADYVRGMARYNTWQNGAVYEAAGGLGDKERRRDKGAFFGSIHETLSHLLWADQMWMSRFAGIDPPPGGVETSRNFHHDWHAMSDARRNLDAVIEEWSTRIEPEWLTGSLTWYSSVARKTLTKPTALLVVHFFNHQTHHRGQVHALLTAAGAPTQVTDLLLMPEAV